MTEWCSADTTTILDTKCIICSEPATRSCKNCESEWYCGEDHQDLRLYKHKPDCKSYRIAVHEVYGRYVVATRDIARGEIIMQEKPIVVGPKQDSYPLCLGCFENVDGSYLCKNCNFPLCSEECEMSELHQSECSVLSCGKTKVNISDLQEYRHEYECITPLRCLILRKENEEKFKLLLSMQSHTEERKAQEAFWNSNQVNIVDYLRKNFRLSEEFSDEEIHDIIGILDTNCFEIRTSSYYARGVYFSPAIMAHNCIANTTHSIRADDFLMVVRAAVPIKKGETIFASYANTLEGTIKRRQLLKVSKFFDCTCERCSDRSELGTNLSSLICQTCSTGIVSPNEPLNVDSTWSCIDCNSEMSSTDVQSLVDGIEAELETVDYNDVIAFEEFLEKNSKILHRNHYLLLKVVHSLSQLYGRDSKFLLNELTKEQTERKIELCHRLLEVADVIEPGFTRLRGLTFYELHAPYMVMAQTSWADETVPRDEAIELFDKTAQCLEDGAQILLLEEKGTYEATIGAVATESLDQLNFSIQELKLELKN